MVGDVQKMHCSKCGRYLFTETDTESGCKREEDRGNYVYDETTDEFVCSECNLSQEV